MKVKAIETFKFAKSCRETVLFQKGEEVSIEELGLTAEQIKYILKNCKVKKVSGSLVEPKKEIELEKAVIETEKEEVKEEVEEGDEKTELPEYLKIENKDDLIKYAADKFSLKIDRRSSLKTVQKLIEDHIDEETN